MSGRPLLFRYLAWLCLWGWGAAVQAQDAEDVLAQRRAIDERRSQAEQRHLSDQSACYQGFSVNSCLLAAKRRHSDALAELKRQDRVLNDRERKDKSAAQLRKLDERRSTEAEQNAIEQRRQRVEAAQSAQQRAADRLQKRPEAASSAAMDHGVPAPAGSAVRAPTPKAKASKPTVDLERRRQEEEGNRAGFERKQQEALQRQQEKSQTRRERTSPLSEALPDKGMPPTPLLPGLRPLSTPAPGAGGR